MDVLLQQTLHELIYDVIQSKLQLINLLHKYVYHKDGKKQLQYFTNTNQYNDPEFL